MHRQVTIITVAIIILLLGIGLYWSGSKTAPPQATHLDCSVRDYKKRANLNYLSSDKPYATLDIHQPNRHASCEPLPLLVWIHGGGFVAGDKTLNEEKITFFTQQGFVLASVGYRLSSPDNPVKHPAQITDVANAVAWLKRHAGEYKARSDDTVVVGYSAGAYLALLLATDEQYLKAHKLSLKNLACAVSLDTGAYNLPAYTQSDDPAAPLYTNIIGTDTAILEDASPQRHVKKGASIPDIMLVTRDDARKPLTYDFAGTLRKAEVPVTVVEAASYTHGEIETSVGVANEQVITPALAKFLRSCK